MYQAIRPYVLCVPDENRFLCFPVTPHQQGANKKRLPLFESFDTRPILPIFQSESDCVRFRSDVMSKYHTHLSDWELFHTSEEKNYTPVYVENALIPHANPKNIAFHSRPTPFDFADEDLIVYMSLQACMGFLVVKAFNVDNHILSINGLLVESSYHDVDPEQHNRYLCENLENLLEL